ncbi:hypothetical protein GCM10027431_26370 [Lysobacter rhizosphaerae]
MSVVPDPPFWAAPALLAALIAALGFVGKTIADLFLRLRDAARARRSRLTELLALLRAGDTAFAVQRELCKRLADQLRERIPEAKKMPPGYDRLFSATHESMNREEQKLHTLIRNITVHTFHPLNQSLLKWLHSDDYFRAVSPSDRKLGRLALFLAQLESHLVLWAAKYEAWIPGSADHALVYLADEERHGAGFPHDGSKIVAEVIGHPGAEVKDQTGKKPKGSGYFAIVCGLLFLAAFISSLYFDNFVGGLTQERVMGAWFAAVSAILLWWGVIRVRTGRPDMTIGQDTINFVIGVISVTIALLALMAKSAG